MKRRFSARTRAAYHEAGHAVIGFLRGRGFHHASIRPDEESLGHVLYVRFHRSFNPDDYGSTRVRLRVEDVVICSLAGHAAERKHTGRANPHGASSDNGHAIYMLSFITGSPEELDLYYRLLEVRTRQLVAGPRAWTAIEAVAAALLERERLSSREIKKISRGAWAAATQARGSIPVDRPDTEELARFPSRARATAPIRTP